MKVVRRLAGRATFPMEAVPDTLAIWRRRRNAMNTGILEGRVAGASFRRTMIMGADNGVVPAISVHEKGIQLVCLDSIPVPADEANPIMTKIANAVRTKADRVVGGDSTPCGTVVKTGYSLVVAAENPI